MTRITFLGATETVTGSKYLVETEDARILVDCGLFQGFKKLRERNWSPLPLDSKTVDAVILTHAHIDHSGFVPRFCGHEGFRGRIHCTEATQDLLRILLPDAGYLQEEQARYANRKGYSRRDPALPLYTREDAERSLRFLHADQFSKPFIPAPGLTARFTRAGHILGSACLTLETATERITFTGDVGRAVDPIMKPPEPLPDTDYLVTESTYGDRLHPEEEVAETLGRIVRQTVEARGVLLVPAFAVGRAQHLLHILSELRHAGKIPDLPVFLDSPMAINATKIFCRHKEDHRLTEAQCHSLCELAHYTRTPEESKSIGQRPGPMIVISASGMATGGRILHHLRRFLPDKRNTVLIVGYQAQGTRGRALVDGADDLKIHGDRIPVCARVVQVSGLSAHADFGELLDWLRKSELSPRRAFVTHGDPSAAAAFRQHLRDDAGWDVVVPTDGSTWDLQ